MRHDGDDIGDDVAYAFRNSNSIAREYSVVYHVVIDEMIQYT